MDSDSSASPLLSLACRFLPHDQWFTTHVDSDWKVKQVKSWLLAKCLPYAAPPSPPLRQSARKNIRPPSPITFAPDPRHRPISPITFAMPKGKGTPDDASEFEEPPPEDDELSEPETPPPEEILPPVQPKKRAILPTASTSTKGDLYSQFTLIRFSTGQLLEDDLPLGFYDMQADELLEIHRVGVIVPLPRANPTRYLDAYWEGWVRVLRMRPMDEEEDSYALYKVRRAETRALEWRDRWLVVREGSIYLCRDESRLIHTLTLADLIGLTDASQLPPSATPPSNTRILLARFSSHPNSHNTTRASSPFTTYDSDSSSALSSPVFAHDSDDSNRPRRLKQHRRKRVKRPDPEFLGIDLKDDSAYVSLLRVLHRHALPQSTFIDSLPVSEHVQAPRSIHDEEDGEEEEAPPPLRHPPSLAHLVSRGGLSLGALPFPEWRTGIVQRARRAGLGRIGKAVEWVLWNGDTQEDPDWMLDVPRNKGKRKERPPRVRQPTSTDGYDSDVSGDGYTSDRDEDDEDSDDEVRAEGGRSETEWVGWMGDLRRQARVAQEERERARAREEARRIAEEMRDAELGMPPLPILTGAEVTIARIGTGVDDRVRRAAMEPTAVVTSLSGINPPSHHPVAHHAHSSHASSSTTSYAHSGSGSVLSHMTPVLSSPSSTESIGFAFSPLAPAELEDDTTSVAHSYAAHTRAHSHTLLHSVSMHDAHAAFSPPPLGSVPYDAFGRRPSMPVIGTAARWGEGSRASSMEREQSVTSQSQTSQASLGGITEVPRMTRNGSVSGTSYKGLLRKKDREREGKEKEKDKEKKEKKEKEVDWRKVSSLGSGASSRPRLSVSTEATARPSRAAFSPPGTPHEEDRVTPLGNAPPVPVKKKKRGLARGVSIRAEKLVKSLDSALDFVDGR
ncbi:hypothetical protein B0H16DRAFT_1636682 [Mycena metata]|uniref:Uncharacterized protein n=1 Tax=Mycena metata TaxID=1033252 RepID=A0AAD7GU53_9AGAR|nr:hypothetical protein B0H16DRAFT_1636682 [Mycena metata]